MLVRKIYPLIICLFILGIFIQTQSFLGTDMSWLLHATTRFLKGGTYTNDFYEINPPMALYINIPPVLIASLFHLSLVTALRLYIFAIAFISILLNAYLLNKIILQRIVFNSLLVMLVCSFLFLPGVAFGQREHIATMLILPYLLTLILRLQQKTIPYPLHVVLVILGGIGFAIKPHFIFALVFCETYFLFQTKNLSDLFRLDNWIIAAIFIAYVLSIFILTPDYFEIVPHVKAFFSLYFHEPYCWLILWANFKVTLVIGTAVFYFACRKSLRNKALADILMLSAAGFFLSFVIEPLYLDYHTIPMVSFSFLLITLFLAEYYLQFFSSTQQLFYRADFWIFMAFCFLFLSLPFYLMYLENKQYLLNKKSPKLNQLITLAKTYATGNKIYVFSTFPVWTYPVVDYAGTESASRFEADWLIPIIFHLSMVHTPEAIKIKTFYENLFTQMAIEDFKKNPPNLVFIDKYTDSRLFDANTQYDYLTELSHSAEFKSIWQHYQYLTTVGSIQVYKKENI